ncbi:hypothetical protein ABZ214_40505, partial [Streptomyces iakyrus]|uniref:hypothetical protein n=1 Tax=Streptomyces iakyrus TaxID=68219 RepID=UPI0033AC66FB
MPIILPDIHLLPRELGSPAGAVRGHAQGVVNLKVTPEAGDMIGCVAPSNASLRRVISPGVGHVLGMRLGEVERLRGE